MNEELEKALLKAAKGYEYDEKRETTKTHTDGSQTVIEEVIHKHYPPNVSAAQMLERAKAESGGDFNASNSALHLMREQYAG